MTALAFFVLAAIDTAFAQTVIGDYYESRSGANCAFDISSCRSTFPKPPAGKYVTYKLVSCSITYWPGAGKPMIPVWVDIGRKSTTASETIMWVTAQTPIQIGGRWSQRLSEPQLFVKLGESSELFVESSTGQVKIQESQMQCFASGIISDH
jgi:hypothetical protein